MTTLLLVLVAFDLAAVHTCAFDSPKASGAARTSVAPVESADGAAHRDAVLHPDHCFCHGLSIGADPSVLTEPLRTLGSVCDMPPGHLLQIPSALDHPPQLAA